MSTTLAITAVLLWLAVLFEGTNPGVVRRFIALPFLFLFFLVAWVFELVSGWRVHFDLDQPNASDEPTRILYEDHQP